MTVCSQAYMPHLEEAEALLRQGWEVGKAGRQQLRSAGRRSAEVCRGGHTRGLCSAACHTHIHGLDIPRRADFVLGERQADGDLQKGREGGGGEHAGGGGARGWCMLGSSDL